MFESWGRAVARRRWWVIVAGLLMVGVGAGWGTGVFPALSGGGFEDPKAESTVIESRIAQTVGRQDPDVVLLYRSERLTVDDPAFRQAVTGTLAGLPRDLVSGSSSYFGTGAPALVSSDRHATFVAVQLAGSTREDRVDSYAEVAGALQRTSSPDVQVRVGGPIAVEAEINDQVSEDLARAEALSFPILMVLLVLVFGSVVAAGLPLAVGGLAILGAFTVLRLLTGITDVSIFSINIVTLLGLGLAIDYALFVLSRFREELRAGTPGDVAGAVARTMASAGRTVAFSGLTVAVSLAGLALFPQNFLRSMAYGGIAAVLVAMLSALTVLPAVLAVLGHRVDALSFRKLWRRRSGGERAEWAGGERVERAGGWARFAHSVMRRPVGYATAALALLAVLALPLLRVEFGGIDSRMLPAASQARAVDAALDAEFPAASTSPVSVLVEGGTPAGVRDYTAQLGRLDGVSAVRPVAARAGVTLLDVAHAGPAIDAGALDVVRAVRATPAPDGAQVLVGGAGAQQVDLRASIGQRLPWMLGVVGLATFVLLFLAFGSVVLPLKAIVMNVLSVAASFGVVVWIFQDGNLSGLLGFTSTGTIETTQPILMLAILFGLSTDYEVFLLSRVREQWLRTGDATQAVATGLQRTGRIITSAALLLVVVIGAFSTSGITFIKMIGLGMAIAIVLDATLVRAVLVPATMRLLGPAAWWAPRPLRRWHERHGLAESDAAPAVPRLVEARL